MKLGSKAKDVDNFEEQLKTEGNASLCICIVSYCWLLLLRWVFGFVMQLKGWLLCMCQIVHRTKLSPLCKGELNHLCEIFLLRK